MAVTVVFLAVTVFFLLTRLIDDELSFIMIGVLGFICSAYLIFVLWRHGDLPLKRGLRHM
jgi:hypothetical protein